MAQSTTSRATLFLLRELVGDVLYFPVWWYSRGLSQTASSLVRSWQSVINHLSLPILIRTMGKPMYGDYTRSGRIISFFFRIFLVLTRLILVVLWTVVDLVLLALWVAGPAVAIALLLRQLIPVAIGS